MSKKSRTWLVLGAAVVASVAANIAAGQWSVGGVAVSAIAPLMFIGTLDLVTHVIEPRGKLGWLLWLTAALVAVMAFVISYRHQVAVALRYGQDELAAHLLPLVVDVTIAVATTCLVVLSRPTLTPAPVDSEETPLPESDSERPDLTGVTKTAAVRYALREAGATDAASVRAYLKPLGVEVADSTLFAVIKAEKSGGAPRPELVATNGHQR